MDSLFSTTVVGLDSRHSIFEIIARVTPLRAASSSIVRPCSCRRDLGQAARRAVTSGKSLLSITMEFYRV